MNHKSNLVFLSSLPDFVEKAVLNVFENFDFFCNFNNLKQSINITIANNRSIKADFYISNKFIDLLSQSVFNHKSWFENEPMLVDNNEADYIATCFYMINCLQEYAENVEDKWDRFDYKKSYQYKFGIAQENLVVSYFKTMASELSIEHDFNSESTLFVSHDIDIYKVKKHALKTELKTFDISALLRNFTKSNHDFLQELINIEQNKGIKAVYFWLAEQENYENIPHADYSISDVANYINQIDKSANLKNGLHKSASKKSINQESGLISAEITYNRYHFLKYNIKKDYEKIEASKIKVDCSLGFSHTIGFRNSYGLPFKPYSPILQKQFTFWVYPLHVMDSSLIYYTNGTNAQKEKIILDFIEKNKENCQIGILWHNNNLFGSYREIFFRILESKINTFQTTL